MFTYIFSLLLIVSLALTLVLSVLYYYNSLDLQVQNRLDELTQSAEELAYMTQNQQQASSSLSPANPLRDFHRGLGRRNSPAGNDFSIQTVSDGIHEKFIRWKISQIYSKYTAYTILIYTDHDTGEMVSVLYHTNDLKKKDVEDKFEFYQKNYSARLLNGETIREKTTSKKGTVFTVGIPIYAEDGAVYGGVFIHTSAQVIRAGFTGFAWKTTIVASLIFIISGVCAFFLARHITRPLAAIAASSKKMQNGDFTARAPVAGSSEVCYLAESFNDMAVQLQNVEQQRRDLLANVSHELRSPVTSIQGYAEGILDGTISPENQEQYLRIISDETHRLNKLINNLLSLSRMEKNDNALNFTDFDLCELTRRILISKLNDIDKKSIEPDTSIPDEPVYVSADKDAIQQVIINLLDNAVKYVGENGKIGIEIRSEKDTVAWKISDNGPGIPEEDRPFIFDRFYMVDKAHTSGKGTGLGLAICKRIMDNHKQSIRLVSGEHGCVFEFTLNKGTKTGGAHVDFSQCED